jgi:hypothetical protein
MILNNYIIVRHFPAALDRHHIRTSHDDSAQFVMQRAPFEEPPDSAASSRQFLIGAQMNIHRKFDVASGANAPGSGSSTNASFFKPIVVDHG